MPKTKKFLPKGKITFDDLMTSDSVKGLITFIKESSNDIDSYVFGYTLKKDDDNIEYKYIVNRNITESLGILEIIKMAIMDDYFGSDEE